MISSAGRLPDFVVIGAAKSGTTTLFNWLAEHEDVDRPAVKEPHYFSWEERQARGIDWYRSLFDVPAHRIVGEASTTYTHPRWAALAAERIHATLPRARLVFLVRHPLERLRSHYRHDVQRGRERRAFREAIEDPDNPYVGSSRYWWCLEPYAARFERAQILVVRAEDLFDAANREAAWRRVLAHLGLRGGEVPTDTFNVSAGKRRYRAGTRILWERGLLPSMGRIPAALRTLLRPLLSSDDRRFRRRVDEADAPVPDDVVSDLSADADRLAGWMGAEEPLWTMVEAAGPRSRRSDNCR